MTKPKHFIRPKGFRAGGASDMLSNLLTVKRKKRGKKIGTTSARKPW